MAKIPSSFVPDIPSSFVPDKTAETITAEPVNWADQIIASYEQEEFEMQDAQRARNNLEYRLSQQRLEKIRQKRMARFPQIVSGWGGVPTVQYPKPLPSTEKAIRGIKEVATPEARREALRTTAGYVGGMHPKHPITLAGVAGGGIEAIYQLGQHAVGSQKAPETSLEASKRIITAAGIEAGEEGLSRTVMKLFSPGAEIPKARKETIDWMRKRGIEPTLAQATESYGGIGILEGIAEGSFTGGKGMRLHKVSVKEQLRAVGDDIVRAFGGMSDVDAGRTLKEIIMNKKAARQAIVKPMYEEVYRLAGNKPIDVAPIKLKFQKLLKEVESLIPSLENKKLKRILQEGANIPDGATFRQIDKQIRQRIGKIAYAHPMEKTGQLFTEETDRILREAYRFIGEIYQNPKYGLSVDAAKILTNAHFLTSDAHRIFDKKLIQRIIKENPEQVINSIIKKGALTNVDEVIAATRLFETLPSEGKDILKGAFVKDLITDKAIAKSGDEYILDGAKLLNYIDRGIEEKVVSKFMSPAELSELRYFGDALRVYAAKPAALGGGLTIKILQAGAAVGALGLFIPGVPGGAGEVGASEVIILLGPKSISWAFRNPTIVRSLSNAIISEGGPKEITRILTRVITNKQLRKYMNEDRQNVKKAREQRLKEMREEYLRKYQYMP